MAKMQLQTIHYKVMLMPKKKVMLFKHSDIVDMLDLYLIYVVIYNCPDMYMIYVGIYS